MTHKRNRTIEEKILDCLGDKIKNIHPTLRDELLEELKSIPEANNVSKCKSYVVKLLSIPEMGRHSREYWISRGWSEFETTIHEAFLQEQKIIKENKNISYTPKQKFEGWTECFYEKPIING